MDNCAWGGLVGRLTRRNMAARSPTLPRQIPRRRPINNVRTRKWSSAALRTRCASRRSSGGRSRPKSTPFAPIGPAFPQRSSKRPPRCRTPSAAPPRLPTDCRASTQLPMNSRIRSSVGAELSLTCLQPSSGWEAILPPPFSSSRTTCRKRCARQPLWAPLIPELKSEIEAARRDLDDLAKTRESIARERDELTEKGKALAADKMRLAALIDARQQSLASAQDALGSQQQRAAELAKKAGVAQGSHRKAR